MNKAKLHQYIIREAAGFDVNIEKETVDNDNFRKVLFTTDNMQLVVMSIQEEIGAETHDDIDQFIRVEAGKGKATIGNRTFPIQSETAFIIPRGMRHNVVNTGKEPLKLYTVYTPSNHAPGTIQKTKEEADQAELHEAGFETKPRGWDKASLKKYTNTFTRKMKGGAKAEGFFDKCVEKIKDKMDNPEGFCASLKDEAYGSTGWRGKDKSKAEVSQDVKKAKFKVEADDALNDYLDFLSEGESAIINDGAPIPNDLIKMLEYDNQPNWIGYCIREYEGRPPLQCKCLQAVKEYAAANPFYQYRIDRYIDVIQQNWDGGSEVPYPTQNPDEREMNIGSDGVDPGRDHVIGYSNHDELTPGFLEDLQLSEGVMSGMASFAIGAHLKKLINPTTADIVKANPGKTAFGLVGSIVLASIIISGVNKAYKKYMSDAAKACKNHDNKDKCMERYTQSATSEKIKILQQSKSMCNKAKNSKKCEKKVDDQITKVKAKYKAMMSEGFLEYAEGLNENFFDKIQKQYEKDKAICTKQFPPKDKKDKTYKKAVVACIRKRKAAWINSMKFNNEMMGMAGRVPSGGESCDVEEGSSEDILEEKSGMKSRIPSAGLKGDVEEGQSEANKKKSIKRGILK